MTNWTRLKETAIAATFATAKALIELLALIRPIVERRAHGDVRFNLLAIVVRVALGPRAGSRSPSARHWPSWEGTSE